MRQDYLNNLFLPYQENTHLHKQFLEILSIYHNLWELQDILC